MSLYYVPINGYFEVEADTEDEAYRKTREQISGFDYDCGDAVIISDEEEGDGK